MTNFAVNHIDHVELFVPDQWQAAEWFEQTLGLRPLKRSHKWVSEGGPLMVSSDNGTTMLALFVGEPRGQRPTAGHHRVAFRVNGEGFFHFLEHIRENPVYDEAGESATTLEPVDHTSSFSVYFCDPYGNRFEVTTYDAPHVRQGLQKR